MLPLLHIFDIILVNVAIAVNMWSLYIAWILFLWRKILMYRSISCVTEAIPNLYNIDHFLYNIDQKMYNIQFGDQYIIITAFLGKSKFTSCHKNNSEHYEWSSNLSYPRHWVYCTILYKWYCTENNVQKNVQFNLP